MNKEEVTKPNCLYFSFHNGSRQRSSMAANTTKGEPSGHLRGFFVLLTEIYKTNHEVFLPEY